VTLVAAVDCGTNSIKLLIGDLPRVLVRESRVVRLGQGVDETGRLADEALTRTFAAIEEFADLIHAFDVPVEHIRFCATSATRDSANSQVFVDGVRERLGVTPHVLSVNMYGLRAKNGLRTRTIMKSPVGTTASADRTMAV